MNIPKIIAISLASVVSFGGIIAANTPPQETPTPQTTIEAKVETKEEIETVDIDFETKTTEDNTLPKGTTKIITEGSTGQIKNTYTVTYTNDIETNRELTKTEVVKEKVDRVIAQGTYVAPQPQPQPQAQPQPTTPTRPSYSTGCTNGTYVNSSGNTVCRPSSTNTGGATAVCRDGTYSYSQHRSGTCSHHGGVSRWL